MMNMCDGEAARGMGLAYVGDVFQSSDGHLYEWHAGVDAWGAQTGSWQRLSEPEGAVLDGLGALYAAPDGTVYQVRGLAQAEQAAPGPMHSRARPRRGLPPQQRGARARPRRKGGGFLKTLLPIAKFATRFIPGIGPVVSAGVDVASKLLQPRGVGGDWSLGALYAAPDGTVYQVHGFAEGDGHGVGADDELGGLYADDELQGLYADEELNGMLADDELQGLYADDELNGMLADDELQGLYADDELNGMLADDELQGLYADDELQGLGIDDQLGRECADEALRGLHADHEVHGPGPAYLPENAVGGFEAYVPDRNAVSGLEAYVPDQPSRTPWFEPPTELPELWKPLW